MSQIKEILQKETERDTQDQCSVIHLFREGTFYRAYEWSAWLCQNHFPELKVTHRLLKGGDDIVFVGFPLTSLDRYTPRGAEVAPTGENSIDIVLPADVFPTSSESETSAVDFANWKQSQPLTEASKKKVEEERMVAARNAHPRLTDVMLKILAFPIEQRSPMECMTFLGDVKRLISEII